MALANRAQPGPRLGVTLSPRPLPCPCLCSGLLRRLCPGQHDTLLPAPGGECLCFQLGGGGQAGCRLPPEASWLSKPELAASAPESQAPLLAVWSI